MYRQGSETTRIEALSVGIRPVGLPNTQADSLRETRFIERGVSPTPLGTESPGEPLRSQTFHTLRFTLLKTVNFGGSGELRPSVGAPRVQ